MSSLDSGGYSNDRTRKQRRKAAARAEAERRRLTGARIVAAVSYRERVRQRAAAIRALERKKERDKARAIAKERERLAREARQAEQQARVEELLEAARIGEDDGPHNDDARELISEKFFGVGWTVINDALRLLDTAIQTAKNSYGVTEDSVGAYQNLFTTWIESEYLEWLSASAPERAERWPRVSYVQGPWYLTDLHLEQQSRLQAWYQDVDGAIIAALEKWQKVRRWPDSAGRHE